MSDNKQGNQQNQGQSHSSIGEVAIEIATPKNNQVMFHPVKEFLRGHWSIHNLPHGTKFNDGLSQMKDIPGMHVHVDPSAGVGRVYDPLKKNPELLAEINTIGRRAFRTEWQPVETIERKLNQDEVATWLYWMHRLVATNKARVVRGKMPSFEELQRAYPKAKIRRDWSNIGILEGSKPETLETIAA